MRRPVRRSGRHVRRYGGLAGVVEQEGEEKQVEAVDFGQELGQALLVFVDRLAEAVDVVDGEEGVLVDGVAVIRIPNNQGVDPMELGDEHFKDAEGVHGAEGVAAWGPSRTSRRAFHR